MIINIMLDNIKNVLRVYFPRYKGEPPPLPQDIGRQEAPLQPARHAGRPPRAAQYFSDLTVFYCFLI